VSSASAPAQHDRGPAPSGGPGLGASGEPRRRWRLPIPTGRNASRHAFIWPALLVVLFLSVFPLVSSAYLSLSRLRFTAQGIEITFIGTNHYESLLFGSQATHFIGVLRPPTPLGWIVFLAVVALVGYGYYRAIRGRIGLVGLIGRAILGLFIIGLAWLTVQATLSDGGRPGTVLVTLIYVGFGITIQYSLGLGLALLATQNLPGRRFFRVVFLLPMMITPVGVAYLARMMADTGKGPLVPIFAAVGLGDWTWVNDPWLARMMVIIADTWQWTPFFFIVLLAALESQDVQVVEAAQVDGANKRQVFTNITFWSIVPVSVTVILIRTIEAFKIIDLPNVFTRGGPGTATESLTLQAFFDWRTLNLGRSAAIGYALLFIVTIFAVSYVRLARRQPEPDKQAGGEAGA
jgi:multiple sugar transport system permease protein